MALTAQSIADHPALHDFIQSQSVQLLQMAGAQPRHAGVFSTQQRWLMGHVGLALYFRRDADNVGLNSTRFLNMIGEHGVASRNTADAFLKEMLKYNVVVYSPEGQDRRMRPIVPTPLSIEAINGWILLHLATLDGLDGGGRIAKFMAAPDGVARFQPVVCDGLLTSDEVRKPQHTFSLFTWLNNGGLIMDRLIAGMQPAEADAETILTDINSVAQLSEWLTLSRTHLARKLKEAEDLGSIGWRGKRGHSVMWVSAGFRREYIMAQAVKLAIIDTAFEFCFAN